MSFIGRHKGKLIVLLCVLAAPLLVHLAINAAISFEPPRVSVPSGDVEQVQAGYRRFGRSYALVRGKLLEVRLEGTPEEIGYRHARLLYDKMVKNEGILLGHFDEQVPSVFARNLLLDLAMLRYRDLDQGLSNDRRREIAASALGFQPDPYTRVFDTYQRFVYLNSLYDIALSFEHSPLVGCTTFVTNLGKAAGPPLLARAFDFEVDPIFDQDKAVFLVRETGKIPFASVAWPGLIGVVSGMNLEGLSVVVHGGRAGEPKAKGEPVVHALRHLLSTAKNTEEAVAILREREPMVSHILIVLDAAGRAASIERVPGDPIYVRYLYKPAAITNHFEGPASDDEKNLFVREHTSTISRYRRADQLVSKQRGSASVRDAVAWLRDREGINGKPLKLGDRSAIDALIATHGVVMNTEDRELWVSEAPHLLGRFVRFDLKRLLSESYEPNPSESFESLPEDPLLTSEKYERYLKQVEAGKAEASENP